MTFDALTGCADRAGGQAALETAPVSPGAVGVLVPGADADVPARRSEGLVPLLERADPATDEQKRSRRSSRR